jgi:putative ABC transport system substrate-binding protein
MRRREFLGALGGVAATWPLAVRAQQSERVRRIGVLVSGAERDAEMLARTGAFKQGLEQLGWVDGRNLRMDYRYAAARSDVHERLAKELVALRPDVILAYSTPVALAVLRETRSIPILFCNVSDPVGSGLVASLARPGGNVTGMMLYEEGITGKWLSMLKEIAPQTTRVALMANPKLTPFDYWVRSARARASALGLEVTPSPTTTAADIERTIEATAQTPNSGLVALPDGNSILHRDLVIVATARHRLPAVYAFRFFVAAGGLMSYGTDILDQYRRVASHVDRILKGANPADIPVETPAKYETTVNLKTARALGLAVPSGLLVAADEVFE